MTHPVQVRPEDRSSAPKPPLCDFLDLKAQFATIKEEVMEAVTRVMESQLFIMGNEVRLFEEEIAALLGAKHAIGCASGTDALILSLLAAGIGAGDEVITTPFSFVATAGSIAWIGAKPVFVDIDPKTYNIDPGKIESAITPKTRAIMPVHLFGLSADLDPIISLAKERNLIVVEDAAQAIGARYHDRYVGTFGDFGCFSFFPSKNLGGAGDGGLITTEDARLAERLRLLRMHGSKTKYHHDILGTNSRLDALQAAVLRVKLRHLPAWTKGRQARAQRYRQLFAEANLFPRVKPPDPPPHSTNTSTTNFPFSAANATRCASFCVWREYRRKSTIRAHCTFNPLLSTWATARDSFRMPRAPAKGCWRCLSSRSCKTRNKSRSSPRSHNFTTLGGRNAESRGYRHTLIN